MKTDNTRDRGVTKNLKMFYNYIDLVILEKLNIVF